MKTIIRKVILYIACLTVLLSTWARAAGPEFIRSSNEDFAHPHDLSLGPKGQYLYVADMRNDVVRVLNPDNLETVARIGEGELDLPHDVAFDEQGRLLVADSGNDRIAIYEVNGKQGRFIREIKNKLDSPEGVTSSPGGRIYVVSTGNNRVMLFVDHQLQKNVGGAGNSLGRFIRPHDIEIGADGLLYVGDPGNNRIQVLDKDLNPQFAIENKRKPFREPKYLALDSDNWLYVADQNNNQLRIYNNKKQEVQLIESTGSKSLNNIEGVEVSAHRIWIADTYNDRIVLFHWER